MQLTPNFSADEFDVHEPYPEQWRSTKLPQLAARCQWLRDLAASRGDVTSAWRSAARNTAVHGSKTTQHDDGEAADVLFLLISMQSHAARVLASIRAKTAPTFGQVIFYPVEGHVHISLATLGSRNGEVRYKRIVNGVETFPFLVDAEQLPVLSSPQRTAGFQLPAHSSCSCVPAGGTSLAGGGNRDGV